MQELGNALLVGFLTFLIPQISKRGLDMEILDSAASFLNSEFASAFFSALAGAAFGVWGAQHLAERATRRKESLDALRAANASIVLSVAVLNSALSLKRQYVSPLCDAYFSNRLKVIELDAMRRAGKRPPATFEFVADLTTITPMTFPLEALNSIIYSSSTTPGRAIATLSVLAQSVAELAHTIELRTKLIERFRDSPINDIPKCQDYFGIQRDDGNTDAMFHDSMAALKQYTDDVIFFSAFLADEMQGAAKVARAAAIKFGRRGVPQAGEVDLGEIRARGLIPANEEYADWLSGFRSPKAGGVRRTGVVGRFTNFLQGLWRKEGRA